MLGPELSSILHRLASVPLAERTKLQKALLDELGRLYAAFPAGSAEAAEDLHKDIRDALSGMQAGKLGYAGILVTTSSSKGKSCPCCGFKPLP